MLKRLGDVVYWGAFLSTAFFAAMAVWVLQHFPMDDPALFVVTVAGRELVTFCLGLAVRDFCRAMG